VNKRIGFAYSTAPDERKIEFVVAARSTVFVISKLAICFRLGFNQSVLVQLEDDRFRAIDLPNGVIRAVEPISDAAAGAAASAAVSLVEMPAA
jgi:hypothetical protein